MLVVPAAHSLTVLVVPAAHSLTVLVVPAAHSLTVLAAAAGVEVTVEPVHQLTVLAAPAGVKVDVIAVECLQQEVVALRPRLARRRRRHALHGRDALVEARLAAHAQQRVQRAQRVVAQHLLCDVA